MDLNDRFLVAMPEYGKKDIFSRSVVYITDHVQDTGTVGVIINKPTGTFLPEAFKYSSNIEFIAKDEVLSKQQIFVGGPLAKTTGYVLNQTNIEGVGKLFELVDNKDLLFGLSLYARTNDLFISVGYSSWRANQLEQELASNTWLVLDIPSEEMFAIPANRRYAEALKRLGMNDISLLYHGESGVDQ